MARAGRVSVGGIGSPVIEAGPQEAREAVVFVHGNPGSRRDWDGLRGGRRRARPGSRVGHAGLWAGRQAARLRLRGVRPTRSFIQGALGELGIERVHLVVHDFGGPFGLFWGIEHPEAWASVVLINVGILPGYTWHKMAKRWRTPVLGELHAGLDPPLGMAARDAEL